MTTSKPSQPNVIRIDVSDFSKGHSHAYDTYSVAVHEATPHEDAEQHHHHSHGTSSHHAHGHHLLQVENLSVGFRMYRDDEPFFRARQQEVQVIHNLSISVHEGEIVAIVGASGSGKTLLADAVMGLFEPNALVEGRIWFDGHLQDARSLGSLRGRGISLVPQSVTSLDPLMRVGRQVEGFCSHPGTTAAERRRRRQELFARYGLDERVARLYPFELSGGMARRVLLCCALMDNPKLIVADEPTPGLDLNLALAALADFRTFADEGHGVMLITHDIELALRVADRVAVFRDGTVIEETGVQNFASPTTLANPFSRALWHALPEHGFVAHPEAPEATSNAAVLHNDAVSAAQKARARGVEDALAAYVTDVDPESTRSADPIGLEDPFNPAASQGDDRPC